LIENAPQLDPHTGLYKADENGGFGAGKREHGMTQFNPPLSTVIEMPWEVKHHPAMWFK